MNINVFRFHFISSFFFSFLNLSQNRRKKYNANSEPLAFTKSFEQGANSIPVPVFPRFY